MYTVILGTASSFTPRNICPDITVMVDRALKKTVSSFPWQSSWNTEKYNSIIMKLVTNSGCTLLLSQTSESHSKIPTSTEPEEWYSAEFCHSEEKSTARCWHDNSDTVCDPFDDTLTDNSLRQRWCKRPCGCIQRPSYKVFGNSGEGEKM